MKRSSNSATETSKRGGASLAMFRGARGFPRPYQMMFRSYPTPEGSVEHVLLDRWLYLCEATKDVLYSDEMPSRPRYRQGERPEIERFVWDVCEAERDPIVVVDRIRTGLARLAEGTNIPWPDLRFGGTEEEILARGTNLCGDLSRLACIAYQVAGLPSRLVFLADPLRPYYGHGIVEVWRDGAWGAVDCLSNVVYRHADGGPASVWDLQQDPGLIVRHQHGDFTTYVQPGQFRHAAIVDYPIEERPGFSYGVGRVTPYYAAILEMADRGWPGGSRWLHGEDSER